MLCIRDNRLCGLKIPASTDKEIYICHLLSVNIQLNNIYTLKIYQHTYYTFIIYIKMVYEVIYSFNLYSHGLMCRLLRQSVTVLPT